MRADYPAGAKLLTLGARYAPIVFLLFVWGLAPISAQNSSAAAKAQAAGEAAKAMLDKYCVACHNQKLKTAGLTLDSLDVNKPTTHADEFERVIRRLRSSTMPPRGLPRPDQATYDMVSGFLETELDREAAAHPNPGRTNAVHRLNRTEYHNAIRDLFGLDVDIASLLPGDNTADGSFDNNSDVLSITTTHLERYLSVARQITRLATGLPPANPAIDTFKVPLHVTQDERQSEDLPLGTRGGLAVRYDFPATGEYLIKTRLRRQYQDHIMGMGWAQRLDVRVDGKLVKQFTVGGAAPGKPSPASFSGAGNSFGDPEWEKYMLTADDGLEVRVPVTAGPHKVGVAFLRQNWEQEFVPQPLQRGRVLTNDEVYMENASVDTVQIGGPYQATGMAKDIPSRRKIFVCQPRAAADEKTCASAILARIARLAYRRPSSDKDVRTLLAFFDQGRRDGGSFDSGIQFALERLLVDPDFLLRVQKDPAGAAPGQPYRIGGLEMASRLSFFLWSSIPDETLLDLAEKGRLSDPKVMEQQVRRMLADPRSSEALVNDFAAQWLNLRRVAEVVVDPRYYPHFDENLLQAFEKETELFVASTLREDRSVMDLVKADYTFVNERLARHYGIPGVYGTRFRRVSLPDTQQRGGLLGQGALLAATSYPDRTSPVLRGKWLLDNIFGMPPPPPPPGVTNSLVEGKPGAKPANIRERLAQHRTNAVCATCHAVIDPIGFSLESFDAIGGWRTKDEAGNAVDSAGLWPNGSKIDGFTGLRQMLLDRPDAFAGTLTEKLMSYGLGRQVEYFDKPTVRKIVRDASAQNYRWSALITGIVQSPAFQMRTAQMRTARAAN